MWRIKLMILEQEPKQFYAICHVYRCGNRALFLQDDKPVCLKHYSKIQHMSEDKHVR